MSINSNITNQDSGKPADFVNSTYEALKYNPQATQKVLQQGPNSGLAGIGAMAANRFQSRTQDMQQMQQAQQFGQNPQPTILQQLQMAAMQGGIMGQLPNSIQMAQAPQAPQGSAGLAGIPVDPNALPQTMAGGGLVALAAGGYLDADGGDYYDAEQGYADGGMVYDPTESPWDYVKEAGSRLSNTILPGYEQYRQDLEEEYDAGADEDDELAEMEKYYSTTEPSPAIRRRMEELRGGRNGEVPLAQEAVKNPKIESHKEATKTDKEFKSAMLEDSHLAQGTVDKIKQAALRDNTVDAAQQIEEGRQIEAANGGIPAIQGQKAVQSEAAPEEAGPSMEEMRDQILALRGGAPSGMSQEERAWREEKAKDANTEKWLQTLTAMAAGTFGGGGRTWPEAIGQGALYGLSAYRQGAAAEGEAELGMLQAQSAYAEAQRKAQQDAADKLLGIQSKKMELGSAADIANQRAQVRQLEGALGRASREKNAAIMAGGKEQAEYAKRQDDAMREVRALNDDITYTSADAAEQQRRRNEIYQYYRVAPPGVGGGQGLSGGMGMGNSFRYTRAGGLQPPRS